MVTRRSLLLDHEADGIRELDNKLPRWWVWLFYLTIIFSVIYMVYYHVLGAGDLLAAEYQQRNEARRSAQECGDGQIRGEPRHALALERTGGAGKRAAKPSSNSARPAIGPMAAAWWPKPDCDDYWIHGSNFVDNSKPSGMASRKKE